MRRIPYAWRCCRRRKAGGARGVRVRDDVGVRLEPRLNLGSSQIVVIVGFGTWVPGLVEPGFQNLGSRTQVRTTFVGGRVV